MTIGEIEGGGAGRGPDGAGVIGDPMLVAFEGVGVCK